MLQQVRWLTGVQLDEKVFTLGFARRATGYKRGDLLFTDLERLKQIARQVGPLQVVYAGKAHPHDYGGKGTSDEYSRPPRCLRTMSESSIWKTTTWRWENVVLRGRCLAQHAASPLEASGTSGMKAALNGVPSLSVFDGWWIEGCIEGVTGWSIGDSESSQNDSIAEAESLYVKLEAAILPLFYKEPDKFAQMTRSAIAFNGSFFNTQRMISQYVRNAYGRATSPADLMLD